MSYMQTSVLSHAQRVRRLYKAAVRNVQSFYLQRYTFRYHAVLMRERFDRHKDETDMRKAKQLLQRGERELFLKQHPQPLKFPNSPGGVAYLREPRVPDWILDTWHPLEKAQYPEYFARREERKKEYIERYEKNYGKVEGDQTH